MITKERNVTLNWTLNPTAFEAINQKSLVSLTRPLGTAVNPVNKMLARGEEMEMLLPDILGTSPQSSSGNWQASLSNYWHNFGLEVAPTGYRMNTSFTFDLSDSRRQKYIDELATKLDLNKVKKVKAEKDGEPDIEIAVYNEEQKLEKFAKYVMETIPEELKYRYGHPADVSQYLAWRYCLISSSVGNTPETMVKDGSDSELKSSRIQFYLVDDATVATQKAAFQSTRNKAVALLSELLSSKDSARIDNILISANKIYDIKQLKEMSSDDKQGLLYDMTTENPESFTTIVKDKALNEIAEVKKFVMASLIRQLPNTTIHVDASNPTITVGSTISEVVSYMAASVNKAYVNELRLKMNELMK